MLDIWTINIVQFINKMFCRITVNQNVSFQKTSIPTPWKVLVWAKLSFMGWAGNQFKKYLQKENALLLEQHNIDVYSVVPENIDTPPMNVFSCLNNLSFWKFQF